MAEAKAAEPNERAAPSPRRPRRKHVINLCCAQSVHRVVEEVARSLDRIGFQVTVVCGAEARAALLGSRTDAEQPTIHVVCVQGSMQERVLKPLRQALATHGGPNHHLFVAVLDLGVPLAMVGQIRRFAEALERTTSGAAPEPEPGVVTPIGREPSAAHRALDQAPTRSYPSLTQVVERGGTKPPLAPQGADANARPRRVHPLGSRPRVAKIGPTSKYQAVTARHPVVSAEPGVHKRRRARSRLSPSARRRPSDERVLGLPEQDQSRRAPAPRPEPPPPPPTPAGQARRASVSPPPATRAPSPTPRSAATAPEAGVGGATTPRVPPAGGKVPARPPTRGATEADRVVSRPSGDFRFTPPGGKAIAPPMPVARPASSNAADDIEELEDIEAIESIESGEPIEPPRITAPPTPPATAGGTVVGPPPAPTPKAPAERERGQPSVSPHTRAPKEATSGEGSPAVAGPRKTIGYLERSEAGKPTEAVPPSERATTLVSESSRTLMQRRLGSPRDTPLSSESSGTLVLRPRASGLDDDLDAIARPASAGTAKPSAGPPSTAPTPPEANEAFESARTLLRNDGTFASARDVQQRIEASREPPTPAGNAHDGPAATTPAASAAAEPTHAGASELPAKTNRTILYTDSSRAPTPSLEAKPAPPSAEPSLPSAPRAAGRLPPSAIPTDRHPTTGREAKVRSRGRRAPAVAPTPPAPEARASVQPGGSPTATAARREAAAQPRRKRSASRYGWLWILLALLTTGGGLGAYQAGLVDDLLGRGSSSDGTIADAGRESPREAGPRSADAGEPMAAASTGSDDRAPADDSTGQSAVVAPAVATSANEPTSGGGAPDAPSNDPEPAPTSAASGTAEPDEPAANDDPPNAPPTPADPPDEPPTANAPDDPPPSGTALRLSPEERELTAAVDARRIFILKTLYTTKRQGTATTFAGGWQRCAKLEVDGVKGWRLPHRREMKLINAVLSLPAGLYWTRTVPDDDKSAAYVLDSTNGQLSLSLKQEPTGEVVCVRERDFPEK
jgi:hypothetical protein